MPERILRIVRNVEGQIHTAFENSLNPNDQIEVAGDTLTIHTQPGTAPAPPEDTAVAELHEELDKERTKRKAAEARAGKARAALKAATTPKARPEPSPEVPKPPVNAPSPRLGTLHSKG